MLQKQAQKVFALDVGYGLLHEKLRKNPQVIPLERINIRYYVPQDLPEPIQGITIDVSFISLRLVFPVISSLLPKGGICIALIKPQFEAGRDKVERGGLVRKKKPISKSLRMCLNQPETTISNFKNYFLPIQGGGNIEYLAYWMKCANFLIKLNLGI